MDNQTNNTNKPASIKGVVTKVIKRNKPKFSGSGKDRAPNGSEFTNCRVEITEDGPMKGMKLFANRTTINKEGEIKSDVDLNEEVNIIYELIEGLDGSSTPMYTITKNDLDITDNSAQVEALKKLMGQ